MSWSELDLIVISRWMWDHIQAPRVSSSLHYASNSSLQLLMTTKHWKSVIIWHISMKYISYHLPVSNPMETHLLISSQLADGPLPFATVLFLEIKFVSANINQLVISISLQLRNLLAYIDTLAPIGKLNYFINISQHRNLFIVNSYLTISTTIIRLLLQTLYVFGLCYSV